MKGTIQGEFEIYFNFDDEDFEIDSIYMVLDPETGSREKLYLGEIKENLLGEWWDSLSSELQSKIIIRAMKEIAQEKAEIEGENVMYYREAFGR